MNETEVINTDVKSAKKINNKQLEKKIKKLEQKQSDIEKKIVSLQEAKRQIKAEISQCRDEQILGLVRSSNLTFEQISESIRLARSLHDSEFNDEDYDGLSKPDIDELEHSEIISKNNAGGIQNANSQI